MGGGTQIISSTLNGKAVQSDGRFVVREQHIDDAGNTYLLDYMAERNTDVNLRLAADAVALNAGLQYLTQNAIPLAQAAVSQQRDVINADIQYLAVLQAQLDALQTPPPKPDSKVGV